MQLVIKHKTNGELRLPINYHHILQSMIYRNVAEEVKYGNFMHNEGYAYENRRFKLFTFGPIKGKYRIEGRDIIFLEDMTYEIRSVDDYFLKILKSNIEQNGLTYMKQHIDEVSVEIKDITIETDELMIELISPIVQYRTDEETGKTHYFSPCEEEFELAINQNFKKKYKAYYGIEPDSDIRLVVREVSIRDKYVTKYKGFYITGWKGKYSLYGKRKYLDFLYQAGLGAKNSQGFGMFREEICF